MKEEIIVRKNIYTGSAHKLVWTGEGKMYEFQPAESWMPISLIYDTVNEESGEKNIVSLDSDGFGYPLSVGDFVDGYEVGAIIDNDGKIYVIFK